MFKNFLVLLVLLIFANLSYAEEQLTITTYYPSPYGSYKELSSYRMKIGRNYSGSGYSVADDNLIVEGMVGIGTANPGTKLEIVGDLKVTGNIIGSTGWTALPFGPLFRNTRSPTAQYPQYRKIGDIVYLRGTAESLQDGREIQNGDLIGTLPSEFRPPANISFMQPGFITAELVAINSSGQIIASYFNDGADWVSLDGIFFSTTS